MANPERSKRSEVNGEISRGTGSADPRYGAPRKFLGMPVWASAVGLAALAAVMYLVMLTLT